MLDFRINTFLTVCKTMNFTKAASELHITQPAVSQHIHFLTVSAVNAETCTEQLQLNKTFVAY